MKNYRQKMGIKDLNLTYKMKQIFFYLFLTKYHDQ